MADAILVKSSRPVDAVPTKDSTNLVESGGIFDAIEVAANSSPPEIYIGQNAPTGTEVMWFDTNANIVANTANALLVSDYNVYVAPTGNDEINTSNEDAPYATLTKAINSVPKNLNGHNAIIHIVDGTYTEEVNVNGFFGGKIVLHGNSEEVVNVTVNNINATNNSYVEIDNIALNIVNLYAFNSTIHTNGNVIINGDGSNIGLELSNVSNFITSDSVTVEINNSNVAIKATELSKVYINNLEGSNNIDGLIAESGSSINVNTVKLEASIMYTTSSGAKISVDAQPTLANY